MNQSIIDAINESNKVVAEMKEREAYANRHLIDMFTSPLKTKQLVDGYWLVLRHHGFSIVTNEPQTGKGWYPFNGNLHGATVEGFYEYPLWNKENHDNEIGWYKEKIARLEGK